MRNFLIKTLTGLLSLVSNCDVLLLVKPTDDIETIDVNL